MAPAGDFDTFSTIFEFYLQTLPFNSARTEAYFGHPGIFYTETKTLFGAFAVRSVHKATCRSLCFVASFCGLISQLSVIRKILRGLCAYSDYGANASTRTGPHDLPKYLESNGYIHYDYGPSFRGISWRLFVNGKCRMCPFCY